MPFTIRQSMLNSYEKCPYLCAKTFGTPTEQVEYDEDKISNKYAMTGIAYHNAMDYWGKEKIKGNEPTLVSVHDKLDEEFARIPKELFKDEEDYKNFYNSLHEQITWAYGHSFMITPVATEMSFAVTDILPDFPLVTGTIDRIDGSMEKQDVDIIDYKSGKVYTKNECKSNIQATLYSLAFYKLYGFLPKRFIFMFSKHKRTKIIQIDKDFLREGTARIIGIYENMKLGNYDPKPQYHFCKNFCELYNSCPKGKKKGWGNVGFEIFEPNVE